MPLATKADLQKKLAETTRPINDFARKEDVDGLKAELQKTRQQLMNFEVLKRAEEDKKAGDTSAARKQMQAISDRFTKASPKPARTRITLDPHTGNVYKSEE